MKTITKEMIETMFDNSTRDTTVGYKYEYTSNTIFMKHDGLEINIYSNFFDTDEMMLSIKEGNKDFNDILNDCTYVEKCIEVYVANGDDYIYEGDAFALLQQIHTKFVAETDEHNIEKIKFCSDDYHSGEYQRNLVEA